MVSAVCAAAAFILWDGPSVTAAQDAKSALVTVVADGGVPFRELKPADFVVKEDGKKREVVEARLATDPLSVALLVDLSQPTTGTTRSVQVLRTATAAFVKAIHAVNPDAQIALVEVASAAVTKVDFTNSAVELDAAISRLYPSQQTVAVVLEALLAAGEKMGKRPGPRRAIVTLDFDSLEGSTRKTAQEAADGITNCGATLWAASVRGMAPLAPDREAVLDTMTTASGGKRFSASDATGLEGMLKKIAASLTSQYIVTFTPGDRPAKATTFETVRGPKVLLTPFMR